ncbi:hypothetical protein [Nostoc sp.]|uniref:hypothetical protein n=1 Tax=Nostoc sp. TaxID=1180 RepID=UPI002FF9EEF4
MTNLLFPDGFDGGLHLPTVNGGTYDTSGERLLFNIFQYSPTTFGYVSRLKSVAAEDNPRWTGNGLASLIKGREYEVMVAVQLIANGLTDVELTPNFNGYEKGDADIWVNGCHIVEVKAYSYNFTTPNNYPYPYVWTNHHTDTHKKYELAAQKGGHLFFVVCSQVSGQMIVTRYNPEQHKDLNRKGDTSISKFEFKPFTRLVSFINQQHTTNNPQVVSATHGSTNNKPTTTNQQHLFFNGVI